MENPNAPFPVPSQQENAAKLSEKVNTGEAPVSGGEQPAQGLTFPSQAEASSQLAGKIDPAVSEELKKADEAQSETMKNLGEVASGQRITTDMHGNILNEHDQEELRKADPTAVK
jgi:hypothetical protein